MNSAEAYTVRYPNYRLRFCFTQGSTCRQTTSFLPFSGMFHRTTLLPSSSIITVQVFTRFYAIEWTAPGDFRIRFLFIWIGTLEIPLSPHELPGVPSVPGCLISNSSVFAEIFAKFKQLNIYFKRKVTK